MPDTAQLARPSTPFLLRRTPRHAPTRRWAERAWSLYPPMALLIGTVLLAAGCRGSGSADEPAMAMAQEDIPATPISEDGVDASVEEILFPSYPAESTLVGHADARATIRYGKDRIELANLSEVPWSGARLWINQKYSALLPHTRAGDIRSIHFGFLRDENGRTFPTDNSSIRIQTIELVTGDERTTVRFGLGY